ncbi:hypothetical protein [Psychromonas sp.]|uniref:hypothetical protein n=1 Tax=Psychromonas sp. TaxID=1884585 RepID=UPI003562DB59
MNNSDPWWGESSIPIGHSMQLDIGFLSLAIENKGKEWLVYSQYEADLEEFNNRIHKEVGQFAACSYKDEARFFVNNDSDLINVKPVLADRPVVCRPLKPIKVSPKSKVILYVSTPIWLSLNLVSEESTKLQEIASQRLSDTWFGPSTMQGDLCYASLTNGRTDLNALPLLRHRAITPLVIHNCTESILSFERVSIPVPMLSVFKTENGQFYTESVALTWQNDNSLAKLKIGDQQDNTILVSGPRETAEQGQFIRAFSAIFK